MKFRKFSLRKHWPKAPTRPFATLTRLVKQGQREGKTETQVVDGLTKYQVSALSEAQAKRERKASARVARQMINQPQ